MQLMTISEAAAVLNVSSNTLRSWEQRFGFPVPHRSAGGHRRFVYGDIAALREGLSQGLSISSAVSQAREDIGADERALLLALRGFDVARADRTVEAALALRSLERTIEEVMLPALEQIADDSLDSAAWAFASQWACGWLARARRLFSTPVQTFSIVIADASRDGLDVQAPSIRALELLLARGGASVLSVPASCPAGVGELVAARGAELVVLAGDHLDDDLAARWVYAARRGCSGELAVAVYMRARRAATGRPGGVGALPSDPVRAARAVLQYLHSRDPFSQRSAANYSVTVVEGRGRVRTGEPAGPDQRRPATAALRRNSLVA
jgi:DNA-binding transcriptional MerR regulator